MNPVKQIGKYQIPLLSVLLIQKPKGWRVWLQRQKWFQRVKWLRRIQWLKPSYGVILNNGKRLRFTEDEKREYDYECQIHHETMRLWGACKSAGLRA